MLASRLILASLVIGFASAQTSVTANVGNFIHNVSDVERSAHFYHDVLGMDMPRPVGSWQTSEAVLKLYNAGTGRLRVANAQMEGSPMRMELAQFDPDKGSPVKRAWGVAGNSILMLTVTDLTLIEQRVKSENVPVLVASKKACDGRGIVVADPDGFPVMLIERAQAAPDAKSNITGLRFGHIVSSEALASGPFTALGLKAQSRTHVCQPIEEALASGPTSVVTVQDGFEIWLFKGPAAPPHAAVVPRDPGAAVLRFAVNDADAAVKALLMMGATVASEGGVLQTLPPGGQKAAILQTVDDLLIQVLK